MAEHPIEGLMKTTMESLKEMVDVNTIVGEAVESPDGSVIIPISRISLGFAAGGGEYNSTSKNKQDKPEEQSNKLPFGGGSGAGVSVQPVAFIVVGNGNVKLLPVDHGTNILNSLSDILPKLSKNFQDYTRKKRERNRDKEDKEKKEE
ncbi:GerW family sporulation protein [Thermohalobacter berrensis]|uniref:Sporulation protein YtfJ n=1 Tax=Thermohalobacter berrensis TaxID=99594 RepID=A0A419TAQ4_9FIRM|nr:GerW family sporulation protein [Thermohalobacter berrensis]RKD34541.1 sporulation protein YtfJ [Thermohalobacter berrensis]